MPGSGSPQGLVVRVCAWLDLVSDSSSVLLLFNSFQEGLFLFSASSLSRLNARHLEGRK